MTLVDANILMYATGREHPHRQPSIDFLEAVARGDIRAGVSAEILQELLHRYRSLDRWEEGREIYDLVRAAIPLVVPLTEEVMDLARELMERYRRLSARDAVHAATVVAHGLDSICSFDKDFDDVEGLTRIEP